MNEYGHTTHDKLLYRHLPTFSLSVDTAYKFMCHTCQYIYIYIYICCTAAFSQNQKTVHVEREITVKIMSPSYQDGYITSM